MADGTSLTLHMMQFTASGPGKKRGDTPMNLMFFHPEEKNSNGLEVMKNRYFASFSMDNYRHNKSKHDYWTKQYGKEKGEKYYKTWKQIGHGNKK